MSEFRKHYAANRKRMREFRAKKFANMRAAKERKRIESASAEWDEPPAKAPQMPRVRPSGFRVTIECLDDGARASFTTHRGPFGLTVSPTNAGRRVACLLQHYLPIPSIPRLCRR